MPDSPRNHKIEFAPFLPSQLNGEWKAVFGAWEVIDGALRHVVPDVPTGNVDIIIADTPDAESFNRLGTVRHIFPERGFDRVHIRLDVSLDYIDGFSVALDDAAVEWTPYYGMKPVLTDVASGSRGHEYADVAWPSCNAFHHVEIIGERERVRFIFNGRELFSSVRDPARSHRQITIDSFGRASIRNVRIDGQGLRPSSPIKRRQPLKLAGIVDFADDLCYAEFDAQMIDRLIGRLADLGIERVYWMNAIRVRQEAFGPKADAELNSNLDGWDIRINNRPGAPLSGPPTLRSTFPFLPKAVVAARKRGMEIYGVIKAFDVGSHTGFGVRSPFIDEHFCQSNPHAMLTRWTPADTSEAPVKTIRFYKNDARDHDIQPEQISVWTSDDNKRYARVKEPFRVAFAKESRQFTRYWEGDLTAAADVRTITLDGLDLRAKYFAVVIEGARHGSFCNRMDRLCEVLDEQGRSITTTRNLPELPRVGSSQWQGEGGFVFSGYTTPRQQSGSWRGRDWIEMHQLLDGADLGIAFMRGAIPHIPGAPNPAHPAARKFWWDWVIETLDAGVDGIDIRIMNHHNILDWANYGFGPDARAEFEKRFGHPLRPNGTCRRKHVEMLGDIYTDFLRSVSREVRGRGRKLQHHVSRPMDTLPGQRPMVNVNWDWRRWINEGLLDSITLKDLELASAFCDEVKTLAAANNVETMHCPYLCCMFDSSKTWAGELTELLRRNYETGTGGIILYEVASFLRGTPQRDVELRYPELKRVLTHS